MYQLRKDIKKKENKVTKVDKSKVEKQVLDNQTLQQIMMSQMMRSRDRVSNGENTSWITVQNQANADRIQAQQKINALKTEKQEWERKAKNIKENEQYKEIEEKLKQEIEGHKKAIEQAQKIIPLEEEIRNLKAQKAELEQKINDPLNQKQIEIANIKNYIKHLEENLVADDPKYKEKSDKIAELTAKLKKYKQQQELDEELNQIKTELKRKESERKSAMEYLRKAFPDDLKGVQYNATDLTEKLQELIDKKNMEIDETNAKIKRLNEQQQILDKYEQVSKEFNVAKSKLNVSEKYLQEKYPDFLKGVNWNEKNIDEIMLDLTNKAAMERDNMNKQLEIMKETSEEMKILNKVKADRDMYEENLKKKHPLFVPILEKTLNELGENRTLEDETSAIIASVALYRTQLEDNMNAVTKANEELDKPLSVYDTMYKSTSDDNEDKTASDDNEDKTASDDNEDKTASDDSDFDMYEYYKSHIREDGTLDFDSEDNMKSDGDIKKKV